MKTYIVSLIHPYYVEYGIVSPMHIIDKEIEANGIFDLLKKIKKQYPKYQIDGIKQRRNKMEFSYWVIGSGIMIFVYWIMTVVN